MRVRLRNGYMPASHANKATYAPHKAVTGCVEDKSLLSRRRQVLLDVIPLHHFLDLH